MTRLEALEAAARKFIKKVETGRARSVVTYRELKAALEIPVSGEERGET